MDSSFQHVTAWIADTKDKFLPIKRTYSLRSRIFQYFLLFLAAFLLFAGLLIYYFSDQLLQNSYRHIHETLALYSSQLEQDLSAVEASLFLLSAEDTDVISLGTMDYSRDTPLHQIHVNRLLANTLPYFSSVDGLFVYAWRTDSFISSFRSTDSGLCNTYIKSMIRMRVNSDTENRLHTSDWYFASLDDGYYLVRIMKQRFCYIGAWTKLDTLTSTFSDMDDGTTLLYVSRGGTAFTDSDWSSYHLAPADSLHKSVIFQDDDGLEYLQISVMPDFCRYYLMAFVPMRHIRSALDPVYHFIIALTILLLALEIFMFFRVNRFLARPAFAIRQLTLQVQQGDTSLSLGQSARLSDGALGNRQHGLSPGPGQSPGFSDGASGSRQHNTSLSPGQPAERCEEVLQIQDTLTSLVDEISGLKINIYEEQIAKTEFELEYLKSQVAPHFLINCFSTICSLANSTDGQAMTQKMVQTLSDHLRYTLSMRNTVPLSEEVHYVENYLELTQIRFPDCLSYEIDIPDNCMDASTFPLLILMFTENTIKYNMVMGEPLAVKITGRLDESSDPPRLKLIHIDSGDGFSAGDLTWMNDPDIDQHKPVDGHGIGFYNVLKRLTLLYGETARAYFSNEPGWGARIDIDIPYVIYEPPLAVCADKTPRPPVFDQTGPG